MDKLMPFPPLQPGFKHWVSTEALDGSGRKGKGSPGEKCYKGKLTFCKKNSWECRSFLGKNATQHNGNLYRGYAWDWAENPLLLKVEVAELESLVFS